MSDKLTARQQAILEYIRTHQPCSNAQLAAQFQCAPSTVTVHLMYIRRAGKAWCTDSRSKPRWRADPPFAEPKPPKAPRVAPPSIEQVSSIWHYAQRCARHTGA